jgi:hypothetical protein
MGGHSSNSSSTNNSQFDQKIPQFQQDALTQLYNTAANTFGSVNGATAGQVPQVSNYVQSVNNSALPAYQQNLQGGAYGGLDIGNQLMSSLNQSQNSPSNTQQIYSSIMGGNGNSSLDAMRSGLEDTNTRLNGQQQAATAGQASAAGMSGSSRQGVTDALNQSLNNQNLQNTEAKLGYDTFNTDLNNKLGIAQAADSNTLARQQLMSGMLGQQQQTTNGALQQGSAMQNLGMGSFAPTMIPWQNLNNYSNTIGSPNVLSSGTSMGSSNSKGGGGGILTS